jgi:hypothetical protein
VVENQSRTTDIVGGHDTVGVGNQRKEPQITRILINKMKSRAEASTVAKAMADTSGDTDETSIGNPKSPIGKSQGREVSPTVSSEVPLSGKTDRQVPTRLQRQLLVDALSGISG